MTLLEYMNLLLDGCITEILLKYKLWNDSVVTALLCLTQRHEVTISAVVTSWTFFFRRNTLYDQYIDILLALQDGKMSQILLGNIKIVK